MNDAGLQRRKEGAVLRRSWGMVAGSNGLLLALVYLVAIVSAASLLSWLFYGHLEFSYDKILSRLVLLFAALGMLPLWRASGLTAGDMGLSPVRVRHALRGFVLGSVMLLPPIMVFMVTGFRRLDERVEFLGVDFLQFVFVAMISALLVGLLEEILFRGVMYTALRRARGFLSATLCVSVVYGLVHFLGEEAIPPDYVGWYTGFLQVLDAFMHLIDVTGYWDSFVALFLLGVLLCWVREQHGLWWCIGLHAAWVFAVRLFKEATGRDVTNPYQVLVGSYDHFVGHLVTVWLLFIFVLLSLHRRVVNEKFK